MTQRERDLERLVAERTAEAERQAVELRILAMELSQAEQRERQRLARVLHDDLQQMLLAAKLRLGRVFTRPPEAEELERLETVSDMLSEAIRVARTLAVELQPPVLRYGTLVDALQWLARRSTDQHGIVVTVKVEGEPVPVDEPSRQLLFDVVRELLLNVVKHSGVDQARLTVAFQPEQVSVVVEDQGCGFAAGAPREWDAEAPRGFGLVNVRERLRASGGTFLVSSEPGRGATIEITMPLSQPTERPVSARSTKRPLIVLPTGRMLRVLVVDDHKIVREGLVSLLVQHASFEVVGEASNGEEAVRLADALCPVLVVMDIGLPKLSGIEATRIIKERRPSVAVIGLSLHDDEELKRAMSDAGASEFVSKDEPSDRLIAAIAIACGVGANESSP